MNSAVQTARVACEGDQSAQISCERAFRTGMHEFESPLLPYPRSEVFWSRSIPSGIIVFDRLWSDSQYWYPVLYRSSC